MPEKKGKIAPKKIGRRPTYKPEYADQAFVVVSEFGAKYSVLAELFKVSAATISNWVKNEDAFLEAIKKGKDIYLVKSGEDSLQKRMEGYEYEEVTTEIKEDKNGNKTKHIKKVMKHIPPDVGATCFVLKNLAHFRWRDIKAVDITTKDEPINKIVDWDSLAKSLTVDQIESLRAIISATSSGS